MLYGITKEELHPSLLEYIQSIAGSGSGGSSSLKYLKSSTTLSQESNQVSIGISEYNKDRDLLLVYKNSVYIENGIDYTISSDNSNIVAIDNEIWSKGTVFNFVVLSSVQELTNDNLFDGKKLLTASISMDKLETEVQDNLSKIPTLETKNEQIGSQLENISVIIDFARIGDETWDKTINRIISTGNKVRFLNKKYELYDTVILKNNTVLELNEETELIRKHDKQMFTSEFDVNTVKYGGSNNIYIKGGTITHNGNETVRNMFLLFHASDIKFKNVTFKNIVSTHAIDLVGCENIEIVGCKFLGYDHSKSAQKYRELIQIDVAGQTGAGLDAIEFPVTSKCFDGTRTRNVLIENCIFGNSDTLPAAQNCIGTHSQVANPIEGDIRSNNIVIRNNTFYGNGIVSTENDDGSSSKAGKCIRIIQMENVTIENNNFKNFGRTVSIEVFKKMRTLKGEAVTNLEEIKKNEITSSNIKILNNTIQGENINDGGYAWNIIAIDSQVADVFHEDITIKGNKIVNKGLNNNRSVGARNLKQGLFTGNFFEGGEKGFIIEGLLCENVKTFNNDYKNVNVPVDFSGAYSNNNGEAINLYEDGINNKYQVYISNIDGNNNVNNPSLRVKSVNTGKYNDLATKTNLEGLGTYNFFNKKIYKHLPLKFSDYEKCKTTNNASYIYPQSFTMDDEYIYILYSPSNPATNPIRWVVLFSRETSEYVSCFGAGTQGGEGIEIITSGSKKYLYTKTSNGKIGKFDITTLPNNMQVITPVNEYNMELYYQFSYDKNGKKWFVEQEGVTVAIKGRRNIIGVYDDSFNLKSAIVHNINDVGYFDDTYKDYQPKKQGFTVFKNNIIGSYGGYWGTELDVVPYSLQGIKIFNMDGSLKDSFLINPKKAISILSKNNITCTRLENEGIINYKNILYSLNIVLGVSDNGTDTGGLIIFEENAKDDFIDFSSCEESVLSNNIKSIDNGIYPRFGDGKMYNVVTGELFENLLQIIDFMANTDMKEFRFFSSAVPNIVDIDNAEIPTYTLVIINNCNNSTFYMEWFNPNYKKMFIINKQAEEWKQTLIP